MYTTDYAKLPAKMSNKLRELCYHNFDISNQLLVSLDSLCICLVQDFISMRGKFLHVYKKLYRYIQTSENIKAVVIIIGLLFYLPYGLWEIAK